MNDDTLIIIPDVFNETERNTLSQEFNNYSWALNNFSNNNLGRTFWAKRPYNSVVGKEIFKSKIAYLFSLNIPLIKEFIFSLK